MNQILCLLICFFVGVLVFYLLKNTCGCKVVEGQTCKPGPGNSAEGTGDSECHPLQTASDCRDHAQDCVWFDGCCPG